MCVAHEIDGRSPATWGSRPNRPQSWAFGPRAICRYGEATAHKTVEVRASRVGAPPILPNPKPLDPNLVLEGVHIEVMELGLAMDGESPKFNAAASYSYSYRDPKLAVINAAVPPWLDSSVQQQAAPIYPLGFGDKIANYNNLAGPIVGIVDGQTYTKDGGLGENDSGYVNVVGGTKDA